MEGVAGMNPPAAALAKAAGIPGYTTSGAPSAADAGAGAQYFDTTTGGPKFSNGSAWVVGTGPTGATGAAGATGPSGVPLTAHATAGRPSPGAAGNAYYDTTLHLPGFSDGTAWRDAAGNVI